MLTKDLLAKWLADLRDPANANKQGKGCLRSVDDKFCCLGRLANIVDPQGWSNEDPTAPAVWKHPSGQRYFDNPKIIENHDIFITPDLVPLRAQETLSVLNDGRTNVGKAPLPFHRIADVVEEMVADGRIPVA